MIRCGPPWKNNSLSGYISWKQWKLLNWWAPNYPPRINFYDTHIKLHQVKYLQERLIQGKQTRTLTNFSGSKISKLKSGTHVLLLFYMTHLLTASSLSSLQLDVSWSNLLWISSAPMSDSFISFSPASWTD